MRIIIDQSVLAKTLARVAGIVERRTTIPILANVMLEAGNGVLAITATDMDMEARATVALLPDRAGTCTAPAQTLADIVKRLPEGSQVELEHNPETTQLTVRAGRSRFQLATLGVEDFPIFGAGSTSHSFILESAALARMIDATRFAISTEETRYYLNGVYLHQDGGRLCLAATDGHRLALATVPLPDGADGLPGVIVPRKAVAELRKMIESAPKDGDGRVTLELSETKLRATVGSAVLSTKLVDGTYPDYQRVIPAGNSKSLEADSAELSAAIGRVATISTEKTRAVKLALDETEMAVMARSADGSAASDALDPERARWTGAALEIGFNSRYLLDIVDAAAADRLKLAMQDSASPCVITDHNAGDTPDRLFVLMPMRV